jgi:hypothetical protein
MDVDCFEFGILRISLMKLPIELAAFQSCRVRDGNGELKLSSPVAPI